MSNTPHWKGIDLLYKKAFFRRAAARPQGVGILKIAYAFGEGVTRVGNWSDGGNWTEYWEIRQIHSMRGTPDGEHVCANFLDFYVTNFLKDIINNFWKYYYSSLSKKIKIISKDTVSPESQLLALGLTHGWIVAFVMFMKARKQIGFAYTNRRRSNLSTQKLPVLYTGRAANMG